MIEYSISIKGDNTTVTHKELEEAPFVLCRSNSDLADKIQTAYERFKRESGEEEPDVTIEVKAKMIW